MYRTENNFKRTLPKDIIVIANDLMGHFRECVMVFGLTRDDLCDIVRDVFFVFLNEGEADCVTYKVVVPDCDRMRDKTFSTDQQKRRILTAQTADFKRDLEARLRMLGCFEDDRFNYFFGGFVQDDIILHRLPY